jgi:hypothetical protein
MNQLSPEAWLLLTSSKKTGRITEEAKLDLLRCLDKLCLPSGFTMINKLPKEIEVIIVKYDLNRKQVGAQLKNWKDRKYNHAGKAYEKTSKELKS